MNEKGKRIEMDYIHMNFKGIKIFVTASQNNSFCSEDY